MAMGEYVSVQSSRELAQRQIAVEADELDAGAAVGLVTEAGGLDRALARARDYRDAAIADLGPIPAGEIRDRLAGYAEFAIERRS